MSAIAACRFCGRIVDVKRALRIARAGGRIFCDEACHLADDFALLDRLNALFGHPTKKG